MKINVNLTSLGCDKNLVDSQVMLGLLQSAGCIIVEEPENADVLIVNTCCFIQDALEESIETIIELGQYKTKGIAKGLIVTGCLTQRYRLELRNELPEVDAFLGATSYEKINEALNAVVLGNSFECFDDVNMPMDENNACKRIISFPLHSAFLKIAEGCDRHCTYCIIPQLRGKYRSREMTGLINEATLLSKRGVRELILVAQDTSVYGIDIYGSPMLVKLLSKLCTIDGIEWIRILYCYPENIDDELIDCIANNDKICNYIDMPIQHINDNILKRMGRKSSSEHIRNVIRKLRLAIPDICIRTSLITGFPGETEGEFNELLNFVSDTEFDRLGVFTYSCEEGTKAYDYCGQIDEVVKIKRKNKILKLQKAISAKKCSSNIGKVLKVLVEGKIPDEDIYCGRSYMDAPGIDGFVFINTDTCIYSGEFRNVKITKSRDYDLIGGINFESGK